MSNRHERERTLKTAKTTPNTKSTKTLARSTSSSRDVGVHKTLKQEHRTRMTGLSPSLTATTNTKHPRKDGQDTYATEHGHEREHQQNHESGVDAGSTTSLHDSTLPGQEGEDSRSKDMRRSGHPRR
ncbi:hypothetical protein K443DRAFT_10604 [Laccaria amethystina LaAM-08-1]|uniref:Uncharacterized protein n=1 Tax=Laccaria amethystina LaAM-08-1 TaxID=1095629 RepID=A0A0C9WKK6_9AGAR|nr:hypothetical protein K443DRAFT_10604 [Laccaria amethystina LaAM-08-1]